MNSRRIVLFVALLAGALSVVCFTNPAGAVVYTWDGQQILAPSDSSGSWDLSTFNWFNINDNQWTDGNDAVFGALNGTAGTVNLAGTVTPNSITFNAAGSGNYTLTGGAIDLNTPNTSIAANTSATINSPIAMGAAQTWATAAGQTLTLGGSVTTGGNALTLASSGTINLTAISGGGGLTMSGPGLAVLSGNNIQYTGNTNVSGGTLEFYNARSFCNGNVPANTFNISSGATLQFYTDNSVTTTDNANQLLGSTNGAGTTITGAGIFQKTGNGILASGQGGGGTFLTFDMSPGGLIDIEGGMLRNGGWANTTWTNNQASMYVASGATFDLWDGHAVTIDALNGAGMIKSYYSDQIQVYLGVANGSGNFSGPILQGAIIKQGTGMQVLSGDNSYAGGTTVSAGTLQMGSGSALGSNTAGLTVNGGVLDLNGNSLGVGALNGSGGAIDNVGGGGTPTLTAGNGGGSGTFSGTILNTSGTTTLTKTGGGTQTLSGANTYSGGTNINQGILTFSNTSAQPATGTTTVAAAATLGLGVGTGAAYFGSGSLDSLFAGTMPNVNNDPNSNVGIDTTAGSFTYTSNIASTTRGLVKLGGNTLTLSGANAYSGPTVVNGGTLQIGSGGSGASIGASSGVTLANNSTLAFNNAGTATFSLPITGNGSLSKSGNGTLVLANTSAGTYSGPTVISGGTLQLAVPAGPAGLVDYYPLVGNANDYIGTSNGTVNGATFSNTGGLNGAGAIYLNGTGANVNMGALPSMTSGTQARTISAWIEQTAAPATGGATNYFGFFGGGSKSSLFYFDNFGGVNGYVSFTEYYNDTGPVLTNAAANNSWHLLTAAWDGNTADAAQIYLDGQLAATLPSSSNGGTNIADLFGIDLARTGFQGYENDLRVYNTALSATQVSQLYALHGAAGYALPSGTTVMLGAASGAPTLDLDGTSQQVVALSNNGTYTNGVVTNSSTNVVTLTLSAAGGSTIFGGSIQNGNSQVSLVLSGNGTQVLTGSNTYSGATTVSSGTLQLGDGTAGHDASLATNTITNNSALVYNVAGSQAASYPINGSGTLAKTGSGTLILTASNGYSGGTTVNAGVLSFGNGALGSGAISLTGNATLQWNGSNTQDISSQLQAIPNNVTATLDTNGNNVSLANALMTGSGAMTKTGNGTLTLTAANSYTGPTAVNGGTLQIGNGGSGASIGTSSSVSLANNATLAFNNAGAATFSLPISGNGSLSKTGNGTLTLGAYSVYSGPTVISGGTLQLSVAAAPAGLVNLYPLTGGNANDYVGTTNGALENGATVSSTGGLNGTGAVYLNGTGAGVSMGALPSMASGTQARTISAWVYQTAAPANGGASNYFGFFGNYANSAEFYFDNFGYVAFTQYYNDTGSLLSNAAATDSWHLLTATWDGNPNDNAQIYVDGSLKATLPETSTSIQNSFGIDIVRSGFQGYENDLCVYNTALNATQVAQLYAMHGGNYALPLATTVVLGAASGMPTLDLNGCSQQVAALSDNGAFGNGVVTNSSASPVTLTLYPTGGGSTTFSGSIQNGAGGVSLVLSGSGTQVLAGANTYSGSTAISGGVLQIGGSGVLGNGTYSAAISNNAALLFASSSNQTLGGVISGSGSLTQAGGSILTLLASNSYTGPTAVNGGTLQIGNGGSNASIGSTSGVTLANNATLAFNHADAVTFSPVISGQGNLYHSGGGTLTLAGANTYSGATTIAGGTLRLSPAPTGLVDYYPLTGGNANDYVGNTNGALNNGATVTSTGGLNGTGAAILNGSGANISMGALPSMTSGTQPRTISAWVEVTSTPGSWVSNLFGFYGPGGNYSSQFYFDNNGSGPVLTEFFNDTSSVLTNAQANNTWHLFTATWDGNTNDAAQVYVDGQFATTLPSNNNGGTNIQDVFGIDIGRSGFTGYENDLRVYNVALTAAQVAQVYALHGVNSELPVGTTVMLGGASGSATLDLNGGNPTIAALSDNGTYSNGLVTNGATGVAAILTLSPSGGASSTFSGTIQDGAGGVSLVMSGNGTQVLAGASTYAGGTTISGGTLQMGTGAVGHDGSLATSGIANYSALVYNVALSQAAGYPISGSGSLTKAGNGLLTLTGTNTYTGPTAVNGGTLQIGNGGSGASIGTTSGVTLANNATLAFNHADATFSPAISGQGNLYQSGGGTLTLAAANTYSGATIVAGGTLRLWPVLADNLMSNTLDANWTTNTTANGNSAATPTTSGVQLVSRGFLNTAAQFDPIQLGGLNITGNWKFISNANDFLQIDTRSSGTPGGAYGEVTSGVEFFYMQGSSAPTIQKQGSSFTVANVVATGDLNVGLGDNLCFDATDGGLDNLLTFSLIDLTNSTSGYVTATLTGGVATANYVTFHNREPAGDTSLVSNVVITSASGVRNNFLPIATPLTVAASATFDLAGVSQEVASLSDLSGSGGTVTNSIVGMPSVLTLSPSGGSTTFSGLIQDGAGGVSLVMSGSGTQVLAGANTYSGTTAISGGVLAVTTLAAGGQPSGLGASTSNAGNLVIDGGTLQYLGSSSGTTDRGFTVGATAHLATIDASGSGTLTFSNNGNVLVFADTSHANTIVLTGSSTAANTFYPQIQDAPGAVTSLVKNGAGTWILAGNSSYSGTTAVDVGKLVLAAGGNLDENTIIVAGGATFAPQPSGGTISTNTQNGVLGSLTLQSGSTYDMTDGAVGAFILNEPGNSGSTALTLFGAALKFDLGFAGADRLSVTGGSAAVSGMNVISVTSIPGLSSLTTGSYPLITVPGGGLVAGDFSLSSSTISVGGTTYNLALINSGSSVESLTVSLPVPPFVNGIWTNSSSGTWSGTGNWASSSVPGVNGSASANDTATFAAESTSGSVSVTLDVSPQVSALTFDTSSSYTLSGPGTLTLSATNGLALVKVNSGSHTISAPMSLASSLSVALSNSGELTLSGNVGESPAGQSLTLTGDGTGTLILSGSNSYTGGTTVEDGTLIATTNTALADGSSLTVGAAGVFIFDPMATAAPGEITAGETASAHGVAAVPEPGTVALLAAALSAIAAFRQFQRRKRR